MGCLSPLLSSLLPSRTLSPVLRGSPFLADAGFQVGEEGLIWESSVLRVGRGGMWVLSPLLRVPLVSQELQLREAQNENARLVEENSRLSGRATEKEQVATLPRYCGGWAPARALVTGGGLSPPHTPYPPTRNWGREYEGYCFPLVRELVGQGSHSQLPATPLSPGGVGECRAEGPAPGGDAGEGLGPSQESGPAEQAGEPGAGAEGERTV